MSTSLLVSLAFLKVNWDTNKTIFLDNFLPFLAECIKASKENVISQNVLQSDLKAQFGLEIPLHVIKALLARARKLGIVQLENNVYYRHDIESYGTQFQTNQGRVQRIYNALLENFCTYALTKYSRQISLEDAENKLLAFISYNQLCVYRINEEHHSFSDVPSLSREIKVIISDYISHVCLADPQVFDYLDTIVKGYMIYNAIYLPDLHNTNRKFRKTKVFLDTTFIMHALGYSGGELQAPCRELLEMLYTTGAQLCCFRHTVEEIKSNLDACSSNLGKVDDTAFGRSVQYFTSKGFTPSDIRLLISRLERNIEYLRIKVLDKPDFSDHRYVVDEERLLTTLKSQMPRQREMALSRDVDSISSIYRLRRGETHFNIEDSAAIFITTNSTLAHAANEFFFETHDKKFAPPCLTDFAMTNIIWLKTPTRAPNLPMKRVISDCYAAIQPDEKLMIKWIHEIEKLEAGEPSAEEDYYFMRYSDEVRMAIMETTLGDLDAITEGSVPLILEKARQKIREEAEKELAQERDKRLSLEQRNLELSKAYERKELLRMEKIRFRSRKIAKTCVFGIRLLIFLLLILSIVISLPLDSLSAGIIQSFVDSWPKWVVIGVSLILLIVYIANQIFGVEINTIINRVELSLENQINRVFTSLTE